MARFPHLGFVFAACDGRHAVTRSLLLSFFEVFEF